MFGMNSYMAIHPPISLNESTPLIPSVLRRHNAVNLQESRWSHKAAKKTRGFVRKNTGLLLITLSQSFLSSMNVAVKKLNSLDPPVSTMELIAARMIITFLCSVLCMVATDIRDPILGPHKVRLLLLLRGFSGFIGLFGVYFSLQYLSLSDATVLIFLTPICTVLAGTIFLGETLSHRQILAGIISLIGVMMIAKPDIGGLLYPTNGNSIVNANSFQKHMPTERLIAVGVALLGVFGTTGTLTTIRAIGRRAHALHSLSSFSGICVLISAIIMIVMRTPVVIPTRLEWLFLLCLIGIFGFIGQVVLIMGLQYETVGRGAMAIYTQIVFATIFERVFFDTVPSSLSVIGTILIIGSALSVAMAKEASEVNRKPTSDPSFRKRDDLESQSNEGH